MKRIFLHEKCTTEINLVNQKKILFETNRMYSAKYFNKITCS